MPKIKSSLKKCDFNLPTKQKNLLLQLWLPAARAASLAANSGSIRTVPVNETIFMLFISLSLFPSNEREIHIGIQPRPNLGISQ